MRNKYYPYDSKAEKEFHERQPELTLAHKFLLNGHWFVDDYGHSKRAKGDFMLNGCVIEFKDHRLNNVDSIWKAAKKERSERYRLKIADNEPLPTSFTIKNGWNHSLIKQAIVSRTMAEHGEEFIVCFDKSTDFKFGGGKEETQLKKGFRRINDSGVNWMLEDETYLFEFMSGDYKELTTDKDLNPPAKNAHK